MDLVYRPPKHLWTKGYVSNQVYRNGYEIYDLYAELIQMAEHEVLIEGMLFDINSPGARKIKEAIALLHEKRKKEPPACGCRKVMKQRE